MSDFEPDRECPSSAASIPDNASVRLSHGAPARRIISVAGGFLLRTRTQYEGLFHQASTSRETKKRPLQNAEGEKNSRYHLSLSAAHTTDLFKYAENQ